MADVDKALIFTTFQGEAAGGWLSPCKRVAFSAGHGPAGLSPEQLALNQNWLYFARQAGAQCSACGAAARLLAHICCQLHSAGLLQGPYSTCYSCPRTRRPAKCCGSTVCRAGLTTIAPGRRPRMQARLCQGIRLLLCAAGQRKRRWPRCRPYPVVLQILVGSSDGQGRLHQCLYGQ